MPPRHNILIVDDDERVRRIITRYLTREGYGIREAASGEEMRARLVAARPDLVILDLMLPDDDGLTLARELRSRSDVPIIIVTGKTEMVDKIVGLELGADDYVTKPFDERELLARVRTVLRRATGRPARPAVGVSAARFDGWTLDLVAHELTAPDGSQVYLTSNQFQVLSCLVTRANRVLSRGEILEVVSGRDWTPMDRSIDVLIGKLRRKVETDPHSPALIKTIRGVGYKLTARVELS
jgi:DNA-binding response OmpR family regulator